MTNKKDMSEKAICELFGKNLKRLRRKAGLSQLALAEKTNLAHTFINCLENGKKWISCKTMAQLCEVFHVEPHQFFSPVLTPEDELSFSTYIDDFSEIILKSVNDFKSRYL